MGQRSKTPEANRELRRGPAAQPGGGPPKRRWTRWDVVQLMLMAGVGLVLLGLSLFCYLFVLGLQGE